MDEQNIRLQREVEQYVHSTGRWYKFFAIVGIVGAAFMLLGGVMMILLGSFMNESLAELNYPFPLWTLGLLYLACAAIEVFIIIYLFRAAQAAREATGLNSNEAATRFMRYTKKFWKFYGIFTIVMLALCIVAIPVAVGFGVAAAI